MKRLLTALILLLSISSFSQTVYPCKIFRYDKHYGYSRVIELDSVNQRVIKNNILKWAFEKYNFGDIHVYDDYIVIDVYEEITSTNYTEGTINFRLIFEIKDNKLKYIINVNDYLSTIMEGAQRSLASYEEKCRMDKKFIEEHNYTEYKAQKIQLQAMTVIKSIKTKILAYKTEIEAIPFAKNW